MNRSTSRHTSRLFLQLIATLVLGVFSATLIAAQSLPKASLEEPVYDFGEISRGETVTTEFIIENKGDAPLEIGEVRTACACTVVAHDKVIQPGEKGQLKVELDTTTIEGPSTKKIQVFTNDPKAPVLDLAVKADSRPHLAADPGFVRYIIVQGFDTDAKNPTLYQKLFAREDSDFKILNVESPHSFLTVTHRRPEGDELDPKNERVPRWVVETTIDPQAPVGALKGYIKVHTDHPRQKVLPIPVSGFVRPVFAVTPTMADFGEIQVGGEEEIEGSVKLRNFAVEKIAIKDVQHDVEGLKVELETSDDGRLYFVSIALEPGMPKGPFSGTVTVETDSPRAQFLKIPVKGNAL